MPLVVVLATAAGGWAAHRRRMEAVCYGIVTAAIAATSLALVSIYGFGRQQDGGATWVYAAYALGTLLAARLLDRPRLAWGGSLLLLTTIVQAVVFRYAETWAFAEPWLVALVIHASFCLAIAGVARRFCEVSRRTLAQPLQRASMATSCWAGAVLVVNAASHPASGLFVYAFVIAGLWLTIAWLWRNAALFTAFSSCFDGRRVAVRGRLAGTRSLVCRGSAAMARSMDLADAGHALALLSLAWVGVRSAGRRGQRSPRPCNGCCTPTGHRSIASSPAAC